MNIEHRDFSKTHEKPEAALAQFATPVLQDIQLGQWEEEKGTKSPEIKKLQSLCQGFGFRLQNFYHSWG